MLWIGATLVQASTQKVRAETLRIGHVYNYYAYGSIAVVLIALLVAPSLIAIVSERTRRVPAVFAALVVGAAIVAAGFVAVQTVVNGDVQRVFDTRLRASDDVLNAFADEHDEADRCATLATWSALPFFLDYYRTEFIEGLQATYEHFHDEPFCSTIASPAG